MKRSRLLAFSLLLLTGTGAWAQEAADSVVVLGRVVNRLSGEAEPYCRVSFLQGADTMAVVVSDAAGEFGTDPMPAGSYGLSVTLKGMTLYRADLVLNSNADLYISVITDSFQLRTLREVEITAPGHVLAEQGLLIKNPDDVRLWDMSGNMEGDASSKRSADPNNPENLIGATLMFFSPGLDVSGKNSTMKNEILLYGRILDTKRRASADKDTTRYEKK